MRWSEGLKITRGHKTAVRYSRIVKSFLAWLGEPGHQRLLIQLGSKELARFRGHSAAITKCRMLQSTRRSNSSVVSVDTY
jgi:hypothetical protein